MNIQPKTPDDSDSCVKDSKIKLSLLFLSDRPSVAFSALTMSVGHPACKKTEWWDACVVVCLERGADLHVAPRILLKKRRFLNVKTIYNSIR